MTLLDTLSDIRQAGGRVWIESGTVRYKAPVGVITPEHMGVLVANKAALLGLLTTPPPAVTSTAETVEGEQQWFENLPRQEQDCLLAEATTDWLGIISRPEEGARSCEQSEPKPATSLFPIHMKTETRWHSDGEFYDIPAGAPGWLVADVSEIPGRDERACIASTLKRQQRAGVPSLAVWLGGVPRVVPQGMVAIGRKSQSNP